jgi:acetolactate synthase-1/2/3 large subunit
VDVFTGKVEQSSPGFAPSQPEGAHPRDEDTRLAIQMLRSAERPVAIAGSGIWWGSAEAELRRFIEHTKVPLYTITMAKGAVSDENPFCMGYADPALNRAAVQAFQEADLFLVLGKRIDYRLALGGTRLFPENARFIQVDLHPQELGMNRRLALSICADVKATLERLLEQAGDEWRPTQWLDRTRTLRQQWRECVEQQAADRSLPMHPAAFYAEARSALPPGILYAWDGGDFAHWGRVSLPALEPGGWLRLGPLGTIGSALPNGLALKMAYPDKPVVVITGDGSLGFYLAEMDSLVRHNVPIVIIVGNDAGWGLERELQAAAGESTTVGCELRATRYDMIMQGFGGGGETVDSLDQVGPAIQRAFASGVPYCLNVNIRGVRSPFTDWQILGKKK